MVLQSFLSLDVSTSPTGKINVDLSTLEIEIGQLPFYWCGSTSSSDSVSESAAMNSSIESYSFSSFFDAASRYGCVHT